MRFDQINEKQTLDGFNTNFNGLASWYSAVMDYLKTLEGHD